MRSRQLTPCVRGQLTPCVRGTALRLECLANALSPKEKRLIVVESSSNIRACDSSGLFWSSLYTETVGAGNFTVDSDRFKLFPIIQALLLSKKAIALSSGDMLTFRTLHALTARLLEGTIDGRLMPPETMESYEAWMGTMQFKTVKDGKRSGWTPLRFAMMAGRVDIATHLLDDGAHVDAVRAPAGFECRRPPWPSCVYVRVCETTIALQPPWPSAA